MRVGQRFDHFGHTYEITKIGRDKERTIQIARRVPDLFGKEALIDHRSFPARAFDQQHLRPIAEANRRHHSTIESVHTLAPEQLEALRAFASANGKQWKSKLNVAWSTGRYSDYPGSHEYGYLQQVRNTFGPTWLTKFSFNNARTHSVKW